MSTDPPPAATFAPGTRVLLSGDRRGVVIGPADGCADGVLAVEVEVPASTETILTASDHLTADLLGHLETSIAEARAARRARYEVTVCSRRPPESDDERIAAATPADPLTLISLAKAAVAAYAAAHQVPLSYVTEDDDHGIEAVRAALAATSGEPLARDAGHPPSDFPAGPWEARDSRVLDADGNELFLVRNVDHWHHDLAAAWVVKVVNLALAETSGTPGEPSPPAEPDAHDRFCDGTCKRKRPGDGWTCPDPYGPNRALLSGGEQS